MRLSVVCVHYHTPELVGPAIEAVRISARRLLWEIEVFVVDNGSTAEGREILESLADVRVLDVGRNLGYGGGANHGFSRSSGDFLMVMNPDVIVDEGCLEALAATLRAGAGCVGPRFLWDERGELLMPPSDARGFSDELTRALSGRGGRWERRARHRWRRSARRHWQAEAPLRSALLSGALLMLRREAWELVGPFDEEFRLYFEETDWLRRAQQRQVELRYVPSARAVHFYDQSASGESRAQQWFAQSAKRFRRKTYGAAGARLLSAAEKFGGTAGSVACEQRSLPSDRNSGWLEVSPSPRGFPAVGAHFPEGLDPAWRLPADVRARHPELALTGRWVSDDDAESAPFCIPG
ncbi:MAG: glycosyltransferase family 2 protein [Acidobacteriota bacterium]